jgi:Kef-type K+ transport system membrane component KefB
VAWIASHAGLEAIIGAFFAGVFFGRTPAAHDLEHEIEPVVRLFAPVFFVSIGLTIIPAQMVSSLGLALTLTAVAVATKLIGCGLPARSSGMTWRQSAIVGSGMVPRGEVGLIVAGIGASGGFLDPHTFSAAAFACVVTILFAPPALRLLARGAVPLAAVPEGAHS